MQLNNIFNKNKKIMSKKRKSNFRGKTTKDAQRQKRAAASYGYLTLPKDVNVYSPDPGSRVRLDILPYVVADEHHPDRDDEADIAIAGSLWYKRPFKIHRNVGVDNDVVVCPTSIGKKCPVCEYRAKRMKEGADKEDTDAMKASMRNLYVVIPLKSKKFDSVPHIWDISQWLFQNLLNEELEEDEDYGVFPDLEEGYSLRIRFDSMTIGKSDPFAKASRIDFEEREEQYTEDILEDIPCLDEVLNILDYKELQAKFFEMDDDADEIDDDEVPDEEEKPRRGRTPRKKEPEPEDDEPEDDEPEDDKPEKKPNRRTRTDKKPEPQKGKCPFKHKFGKDWDEFDDCDECDEFDACGKASEEE